VKTKKQRFFSTTLTVQVPTKHFVVVVNFISLLSLISLRISLGISITFETSRLFQQFSFTWNSNNVFFQSFQVKNDKAPPHGLFVGLSCIEMEWLPFRMAVLF
jgi:hypothetical protein